MADRIEQFAVTCPASTAKATPIEVPTVFNPGELEEIEIVVPDGHSGLTGIALALAHQVVVPNTPGQYITSNDEVIHWPVSKFPNSGAWSAFVYNTDLFDHVWYVRFLVRELGSNVHLTEPTAPGDSIGIVVGGGDLGGDSGQVGGVIDVGDTTGDGSGTDGTTEPGDTTDEPPPDDTGTDTGTDLEPVDTTVEPVGDIVPDEPPPDVGAEEIVPPPPPPPPPPVIPTYPLPVDYTPGWPPIAGMPPNIGLLIGWVLGAKNIGGGSSSSGQYTTWRFFSNLGNTMDWNFYYSGAKALQWVGGFNLRTGVPGG